MTSRWGAGPATLDAALRRHGSAVLALVLLAFAIYGPALSFPPRDADNLIALSIGAAETPWRFLTDNFVTYVPGYRPFAYLTIWLQEHLFGASFGQLFSFNALALAGAALGVYGIVAVTTGVRLAAAVAGAALLLDGRAVPSMFWLGERQSTLACALGALALVLALRAGRDRRLGRGTAGAIFALLLVASGCKEFGIAFAAAIAVAGLLGPREQRRTLLAASIAPVVLYLTARAALAGISLERFCESMGLGTAPNRNVCYADLTLRGQLEQQGWNAISTFVGTFFPSAFDAGGTLLLSTPRALGTTIPWSSLAAPVAVLALAVAGAVRRPRLGLVLLTVIAANAVLNVALYRQRNQLAGVVALDAAAGLGLAELALIAGRRPLLRAATAVAAAVAVVWAGHSAARRNAEIESARVGVAAVEPCTELRRYPRDIAPEVVARVKRELGAPDPFCRDGRGTAR